MRARSSLLTILTWLIIGCLDCSSALFFKSWKSGIGHGGARNYGSSGYGNYGYGNYAGGYGNYAGGYGYNYPSYPAHSSYSYPSYSAYPSGGRRPSGNRQGRTYSDIARVINPAPYVGPGGSRFLPRTPFSPLWG
ncbi:prisilkin-39 [Drosophila rhopaloa]|uniref:Prisilkin-39 n=1 Tax=Drosophila rhopaloa TaxID=1041015 RepID=A0A6P4F8V1_DRORH|nr:prisilkin-39 [Drosophila rhopaloa]